MDRSIRSHQQLIICRPFVFKESHSPFNYTNNMSAGRQRLTTFKKHRQDTRSCTFRTEGVVDGNIHTPTHLFDRVMNTPLRGKKIIFVQLRGLPLKFAS